MHPPGTRKELRIFLGLVNYMGPFIPNLADHTASLRELLREDVEYSWSSSQRKVFNTTILLIAAQTTLASYYQKQPVILQVDALTKGLGATLVQNGRPIAFASKALTPAETRFANIERELLAVMYGCEKFHTYLYGRRFKVESDHRPLQHIHKKNLMKAPPRLQCILLRIQAYDCEICYKPGKEMVVADALS